MANARTVDHQQEEKLSHLGKPAGVLGRELAELVIPRDGLVPQPGEHEPCLSGCVSPTTPRVNP